jgi:hypothetical protein
VCGREIGTHQEGHVLPWYGYARENTHNTTHATAQHDARNSTTSTTHKMEDMQKQIENTLKQSEMLEEDLLTSQEQVCGWKEKREDGRGI